MTQIIERTEAHYDTHEVPFASIHEWHPEHNIIIECSCGEQFTLFASSTTTACRCGTAYGGLNRSVNCTTIPSVDHFFALLFDNRLRSYMKGGDNDEEVLCGDRSASAVPGHPGGV